MSKRKLLFIAYSWVTVFAWVVVIFWFSSLENLEVYSNDYSHLIERITYLLSYGFLLLTLFRALISTFRLTVDRLAYAKGKREKKEDKEFVIIVETLLLTNAILIACLLAVANYHFLDGIEGRINDTYTFLANIIGILISALITYSWPVLNDIELKAFKLKD